AAPLGGAAQAEFQCRVRAQAQARAEEFCFRDNTAVFELAGEQYELPRAEPAQPAVFGRVRLVAGQPGGGYWSRITGEDQAVLPARAPPARDGAGTGNQVGAAQGEVAFVPAGGFVVPVLGVSLFEAGTQ